MILIGQYDSPFVRRVGIALRLYGIAFDHRPLSVFADGEAIRALNPLMRVPTLVLPGGLVLTDSHVILDHLDGLVDTPLLPRGGLERATALRAATLCCGAAEKAVSLFYEKRLHDVVSPQWSARCALQIGSVLTALDHERSQSAGHWWFGDQIGHADIALACALRFVREAHPGLIGDGDCPHLQRAADKAEALPEFREIFQPFAAPA